MAQQNESERICGEVFFDPSETLLCVAGKKQLDAFLDQGKIGKGFAVLSDRAIYCKGDYRVSRDRRHYALKRTDFRIDLEEFQGMKYLQQRKTVFLVLACCFLLLGPVLLILDKLTDFGAQTVLNPTLDAVICILLSGIFFLLYNIRTQTFLELIHTNGSMGLDLRNVPEKEEKLLIRYLRAFLNSIAQDSEAQ